MGSPPSLQVGSEEEMWPAPTAEDWATPCPIPWQRSFEDAIRVARATDRPILVAVNMDGEIASQHWAGVLYRRPEVAKLLEPYVCVLASVYRHTPRDYDEEGRRVECPRFGTVTCGEHVAAETALYERYFDGRRIAPRHIVLDLELREVYDVYFSWDTATVLTTYRTGIEGFPPPKPGLGNDAPLTARMASADVADRVVLEQRYLTGGRPERRELLEMALRERQTDHTDLLRLAIFGLDLDLARLARQALANGTTEGAVDLIAEALKVPLPADERDMLLAAAARLGESFPRARTLVALHEGSALGSRWIEAPAADDAARIRAEYDASARERTLVARDRAAAERPADGAAQLDLADSFVAAALEPGADPSYVALLLVDAASAADAAEGLGERGWRLDAVRAALASLRGDRDAAHERAVLAVEGGMGTREAGDVGVSDATRVRVLTLFAQARQRAIGRAYREKTTWPPEWLADVNAAYALLAESPLATDETLLSFYDFLRWLGATPRANEVLAQALARFPASPLLHDRLRAKALWDEGPDGLEKTYAARLEEEGESADLVWFAGYASLVAAEHFRRAGRVEEALAAYDRGIVRYERSAELAPDGVSDADHYVAMALAGRARLALEAGDLDRAAEEILASFQRKSEAAANQDGLGLRPLDTARMLVTRAREADRSDLAERVQGAIDALPPHLLEAPVYDRAQPVSGPRRRSR